MELWDELAPLETLSVEELKVLQAKLQAAKRVALRRLDQLQVRPIELGLTECFV